MRSVDKNPDLGAWMLGLVKRHDDERPRSQQVTLGPSELGGCREYIRSFVENEPAQPETEFKAAAFVGTAVGAYIEAIFGELVDAITQLEIVANLTRTGVTIAGSADAIILPISLDIDNETVRLLVQGGMVVDFKTKNGLADVETEGSSLENIIQISVYLVGAVQMGVLPPTASGVLVYVDRAGTERRFVTTTVDYEEALRWVDLAEERLMDVQEVIARGSLEEDRWALRDKSPSRWCLPVQCPYRENCWGGSDHLPTGKIEHPDEIDSVNRYVKAQADEKHALSRKAQARRELLEIRGITPDGTTVAWSPTGRQGPDGTSTLRLDVRVKR